MTQRYAIESLAEALDYLDHALLGLRYRECVSVLQDLQGRDAEAVCGPVDVIKLRSSLTLFARASGASQIGAALKEWSGDADPETLRRLGGK